MNVETYRHALIKLLADADRLGSTPDDLAARAVVLAELRHAIADGLVVEEDDQQKPARVRLVWGKDGNVPFLAPVGADSGGAYYTTSGSYAFHFPCGGEDHDLRVPVNSLTHGLRVITDMARADGYECDDHPDAAPAEQPPEQPPTPTANDGWIPWSGGECPCLDWPEVEYKLRDGYSDTLPPGRMGWEHRYGQGDVIAYRRPRP